MPGGTLAVVVIVTTVDADWCVESRVTEAGLKLHAAPVGRPVHEDGVKLNVPLKLLMPVMVKFRVPEPPAAGTLTIATQLDKEKSAAPPGFVTAKLLARLQAFTEPRPVARSKPVPALKPVRIPLASPCVTTLQFGVFLTHGEEIVPTVTSWKMQELAGAEELQVPAFCWAASE